tara:strand:- start:3922 stop:4137 length:216 start_codon:yes stop_codon:yes gene_type:complete
MASHESTARNIAAIISQIQARCVAECGYSMSPEDIERLVDSDMYELFNEYSVTEKEILMFIGSAEKLWATP